MLFAEWSIDETQAVTYCVHCFNSRALGCACLLPSPVSVPLLPRLSSPHSWRTAASLPSD